MIAVLAAKNNRFFGDRETGRHRLITVGDAIRVVTSYNPYNLFWKFNVVFLYHVIVSDNVNGGIW